MLRNEQSSMLAYIDVFWCFQWGSAGGDYSDSGHMAKWSANGVHTRDTDVDKAFTSIRGLKPQYRSRRNRMRMAEG
jgi:hypothetical protein